MVAELRLPRPERAGDGAVVCGDGGAAAELSVFTGSELPFPSVESAAAAYAELWYRVLSDEPRALGN